MEPKQQNRVTNVYVSQPRYSAPGTYVVPPGTIPTGSRTISENKKVQHINWGGVAKGAAIVAGLVVVGVVGAWLFSTVAGWLAAQTVTGAAMNSLVIGGHGVINSTGTILSVASQQIGGIIHSIAAGLHITLPAMTAAAPGVAGAVTNGAGTIGFLSGVGLFFQKAFHSLTATQFMTESVVHTTHMVPDIGAEPAADATAAVTATKAMKVGYHAADDHNDYQNERSQRTLMAKRAAANSWVDYVNGGQPTARQNFAPVKQEGSFAERVEAAQATNLNTETTR